MLSIFPELLFLAPFSAFIIRVCAAAFFATAAYSRARQGSFTLLYALALFETLAALSLAIGYFAQIGALLGVLVTGIWLITASMRPYARSTAFLLLIMCLSVLVTGPGAFAFDLPL